MRVASLLIQPSDPVPSELSPDDVSDYGQKLTTPDVRELQGALNLQINMMWTPGATNGHRCVTKVVSDYDPCKALARAVFETSDSGEGKFAFNSFLADPMIFHPVDVRSISREQAKYRRDLVAHGEEQAGQKGCGIVAYIVPVWEFAHMARLLGGKRAEGTSMTENIPGTRAALFTEKRVATFFLKPSADTDLTDILPARRVASRARPGLSPRS